MEGSSRSSQNYLEQWQIFHAQQGAPFVHVPSIDKKPLDFFKFKKKVQEMGGLDKVFSLFIQKVGQSRQKVG